MNIEERPLKVQELVQTWLEEYQKSVNEAPTEANLAFYAENATVFGLQVNWSRYVPEYARKGGEPLFGESSNFEFSEILTIDSFDETAFAAVLWKDQVQEGGKTRERFGRATFLIQIQDENFLAIHSHFSEFPVC
jgi:ketosteroid isomerase-like protein